MSFKIFTKTQSFGNIDLEGVIGLEMSIHRIRNGSSSGILMFFFFVYVRKTIARVWLGPVEMRNSFRFLV